MSFLSSTAILVTPTPSKDGIGERLDDILEFRLVADNEFAVGRKMHRSSKNEANHLPSFIPK
jgi:hypothetical protein